MAHFRDRAATTEFEYVPVGEREWRVIDPRIDARDPARLVGFIEMQDGETFLWHLGHTHGRLSVADVAAAVRYFTAVAASGQASAPTSW